MLSEWNTSTEITGNLKSGQISCYFICGQCVFRCFSYSKSAHFLMFTIFNAETVYSNGYEF